MWELALTLRYISRVPLMSRNAYDIIFRVVELGVALWFPCVLWNCMSPEQLWILNPKKILKKLDIDRSLELGQPGQLKSECVIWISPNKLISRLCTEWVIFTPIMAVVLIIVGKIQINIIKLHIENHTYFCFIVVASIEEYVYSCC